MLFARSFAVLGLAMALILIGINSQAGWLFWLASMLLSALLVSWLLSAFQVRRLSIERKHEEEIAEDELLEVNISIRNRGLVSRSLLEVIDTDPCSHERKLRLKPPRRSLSEKWRDPSPAVKLSPGSDGGQAAFLIPRLAGKSGLEFTYERGGLRRGIYDDWPGFFYSEGIIGLARHSSLAQVASRLVVFPSYALLKTLPFIDSPLHPQQAPRGISSKGAGVDYYGVRELRPGDPIRHIHWRTTARRGELVVKEFETEVGVPLVILIDTRLEGDGNGPRFALDSAARLAASVARYAYYTGHPVAMSSYKGSEPDVFQIPSFRAGLRWLASLELEARIGPEEQVEGLGREFQPGYFFFHILPAKPFDYARVAAALPPLSHVALLFVDIPSHNGKDSKRGAGQASDKVVEDLEASPFNGLFSASFYRKGDDLRECLEKPRIIFASSRLHAR